MTTTQLYFVQIKHLDRSSQRYNGGKWETMWNKPFMTKEAANAYVKKASGVSWHALRVVEVKAEVSVED